MAVPVLLRASAHGVPAETVPAVADAWITGADDMKSELNGKACWILSVTATWFDTNAVFAG